MTCRMWLLISGHIFGNRWLTLESSLFQATLFSYYDQVLDTATMLGAFPLSEVCLVKVFTISFQFHYLLINSYLCLQRSCVRAEGCWCHLNSIWWAYTCERSWPSPVTNICSCLFRAGIHLIWFKCSDRDILCWYSCWGIQNSHLFEGCLWLWTRSSSWNTDLIWSKVDFLQTLNT